MFPLAAFVCALSAWVLLADEDDNDSDERRRRSLPSWVTALVTKHFPGTELLSGHREGDRDENRFEVKLRRGEDGRRISADLTEEIGIVEIDESLGERDFPERVLKGLHRAFPKARIEGGEKNTDIRVSYKLFITSDGKKREVQISPRGRILEIEKRD